MFINCVVVFPFVKYVFFIYQLKRVDESVFIYILFLLQSSLPLSSGHSSLLDSIRQAGGAGKAKLKNAKGET